MNARFYSFLKSTHFRIAAMIFTSVYFVFLFFVQHERRLAMDPKLELSTIDAKTKNIATPVRVGLHIHSFPKFSFETYTFTLDCIVWFRFPAASETLKTLSDFTLYNSELQCNGQLLYKSNPIIKIIKDDVLVCYHVQATFKTNLNYKYFPMGDHSLHIVIQNKPATAQEFYFISDNNDFTISPNTIFFGWKLIKKYTNTGCYQAILNNQEPEMNITYPAAIFSIDFGRSCFKHFISLYLPMLILFLICLLSLILKITDSTRLALITGTAPSLILFRLVINSISPHAGQTTHIDFVFYVLALLSLFILFFQIYTAIALLSVKKAPEEKQEKTKKSLDNMSNTLFILILVTLILFVTYSFYR